MSQPTVFFDILEGLQFSLVAEIEMGEHPTMAQVLKVIEETIPETKAYSSDNWLELFRRPLRMWWPAELPLFEHWDIERALVSRAEMTLTAEALECLSLHRPGVIKHSVNYNLACFEVEIAHVG